MSNKAVETNLQSLEDQLKQFDKIKIPQYQRSYDWGENEVATFWADIRESMNQDRESYFIGPIVTKLSSERELELIDGQQRITTSLLILSAIRRLFIEEYEKTKNIKLHDYSKILEKRFVLSDSLEDENNGENRYLMNEENMPVFDDFIVEYKTDEEVRVKKDSFRKEHTNFKLLNAYLIIRDNLRVELGEFFDEEFLKNIVKYVFSKLKLINIKVGDESDAFLIFETLNDRGKALDTIDLIKNVMFSKVKGSNFERVKKNWIVMQSNLDKADNPNEFLSSLWMSQADKFTKTNIFDDIKKRISKSEHEVVKFSELLVQFSEVYNAVRNTKDEFWIKYDQDVRKKIGDLKQIKAKAVTPILMAAAVKFTPEEFKKLISNLLVIQVRYILISEASTQKYSSALAKIPKRIFDGGLIKARQVYETLNEAGIYISDLDFKEAFSNVSITDTTKVKYLLSEIEHSLTTKDRIVNPDGNIVNIEHLVPKSESEEWPEEKTKIEADDYTRQVNRLGNLFLTNAKLNGKMKQYGFEKKIAILFSKPCEFETTKGLESKADWTLDSIVKRQKYLAKLAVSTWRIPS